MRAFVMLAVLLLAGCANQVPTPPPEVKYITVPPPRITAPAEPAYPVATLQHGAAVQDVLKAYAASFNACVGYTDELTVLIKGSQ